MKPDELVDLLIGKERIARVPQTLFKTITNSWSYFDSKLASMLEDYRIKTKDLNPYEIISVCMKQVSDTHPITPEYCKKRIYFDRFVFQNDIPDKRTLSQYAKEAAHYQIMQEAKSKIQRIDFRKVRANLIRETIGEVGRENISLITDRVHQRLVGLGGNRDTTYRAVKKYIRDKYGEE